MLPLNNDHAVSGSTHNEFVNLIAEFMPGGWSSESVSQNANFGFSFSSTEIGSTTILSTYQTPSSYEGGLSDSLIISIPFSGHFEYDIDGKKGAEVTKKVATFMAGGCKSKGSTIGEDPNICVAYNLDPNRLQVTLNSILGHFGSQSNVINLDESRELPMRFGKDNLFVAFEHLTQQMNAFKDNPKIIKMLGIEDQLYRYTVMLLAPKLVLLDQAKMNVKFNKPMSVTCEYIKEHLTETLTLTDLERVSGLSSRALQHSFGKQFGCTPLEWIRHERLCLAKQKLSSGNFTRVTDVALECGFGNLGYFSKYYRACFGELPSETLNR